MIMYLTLLLCSYFYERDFLYSTKFQVAYFELSYSWVRKIPRRRERLPTPVFLGFPCGSAGKESSCSARDLCLIPGLGRSPGEGKGYPLQYSWVSPVVQLVKNLPEMQETPVRFLGWEDLLEKGTATHSSMLAWRIPWTTFHGVTKNQTRLSLS